MDDIKQPWILAGYSLFSKEGLTGLKVEVLARKVNKNKSSFYHHFADTQVFTEYLLNHHLERAKLIAEKEKQCKTMIPDMLHILLEVKEDLFFSRQLRINRNTPDFRRCFEKTDRELEHTFLRVWSEALGLSGKISLAQVVLNQNIENFYVQITEETLTYEWLLNYIHNTQTMVAKLLNDR